MKLVVALAATAMIAAPGIAAAKTKHVSIQLDGWCNKLDISTNLAKSVSVALENDGVDNCDQFFGIGLLGHAPGFKKNVTFTGHYLTQGDDPGVYMTIFQYPFVTGGNWWQYVTYDGLTTTLFKTGTYSVIGTPGARTYGRNEHLRSVRSH
jgi:hypothetical protein